MSLRKLPTVRYLVECFLYEKSTGRLYWKHRPRKHFSSNAIWKMFNTRFAGREAFGVSPRGYRAGSLDSKYCAAHRVIWKLETGKEPPAIIDHVNRNRLDNRLKNLRKATQAQNMVNCGRRPNNTTGFRGVHKHKNKNRWVAQIGAKGQRRYLGIFDSAQKAYAAWLQAARSYYGDYLNA